MISEVFSDTKRRAVSQTPRHLSFL